MRLEYQVLAAVALDLCLGDPRWLPHPVRGIGWLASRLESWYIRVAAAATPGAVPDLPARLRFTGLLVAMAVYAVTGLAAWGAIYVAGTGCIRRPGTRWRCW